MSEPAMSQDEMARVFTEWERRYRETPEEFTTEFEHAAMGIDEYGARAAAYFVALATELRGPATIA